MNSIVFFFLSVRDPKTDFRRALVTALRCLGYQVTYVRLARNCFVDGPTPDSERKCSLLTIAWWMARTSFSKQKVVIFSSVNLGFPIFCGLLRLLSWRATWCFDLHDDLLYELSGVRRALAKVKLSWHETLADLSVRAAPNLSGLHPRSYLLGNASSIKRVDRFQPDLSRILVFSNIDSRFDFELFGSVAKRNRDLSFNIYGGLAKELSIKSAFAELLELTNVVYHGPYENTEIASILEGYDVTLAPYRLGRSTKYIDPLRYYHCLNSGLEVITSPIPRAIELRERLHIFEDVETFRFIVNGLRDGSVKRKNANEYEAISWEIRAHDLIEIIRGIKK